MQWTESNETTQSDRRQSDLSALLFEVALFVLVVLLLTFTAHAQEITVQSQTEVSGMQAQIQAPVLANASAQARQASTPQNTLPAAQQNGQQNTQQSAQQNTQTRTHVILVSVSHRKLALIEDGKVMRIYTIAVGKKSTPTPKGKFVIVTRINKPTWSHKGKVVKPGPENPVGSRWIGLSAKGYGIHGTNAPESIGQAASHGCVRMGKKDIEELFTLVNVGDEVDIRTEDDNEVAAIFDAQPAAPQLQASATTIAGLAGGQ